MSRSASITIKTPLEKFEIHAGSRSIPEQLGMKVGETKEYVGRNLHQMLLTGTVDWSSLGPVRRMLIGELEESLESELNDEVTPDQEITRILNGYSLTIEYFD